MNLFLVLLLVATMTPAANAVTISLGVKLIRIAPGSFVMGSDDGDWDEQPVHQVTITRPFLIATTEVTNVQYEQFDPSHRKYRGARGVSNDDDEAVVCVSWHDAMAFCKWLSRKEGKPYRLPTEAEWEYACRAGTSHDVPYGRHAARDHSIATNPSKAIGRPSEPRKTPNCVPRRARRLSRFAWRHDAGQRLRSARHARQRRGMVQRLVWRRIRRSTRNDPVGPADGYIQGLARRQPQHVRPHKYLRSSEPPRRRCPRTSTG